MNKAAQALGRLGGKNMNDGLTSNQRHYRKHREKRMEYNRAWRERNRLKIKDYDRSRHRHRWLRRYGLTPDDYSAMMTSQGGMCAICGHVAVGKNLHVDHCHDTGNVRGLLCHCCNVGLGSFRHSGQLLAKAREYLDGESVRSINISHSAQSLGRKGGQASTEAKRKANAKKIRQFWADVRAGKRPAPRKRGKDKPSLR